MSGKNSVVWAKFRNEGLEMLIGVSADYGFRAVMPQGCIERSYLIDFSDNKVINLNTDSPTDATEFFCREAGVAPPPEGYLITGECANEAFLETNDTVFSVIQTYTGTILHVRQDSDAAVIEWSGSRTESERHNALMEMFPRLQSMMEFGEFDLRRHNSRMSAGVRDIFSGSEQYSADSISEVNSPLYLLMHRMEDGWTPSQIVGLTREGWVVRWDREHGNCMTDFRTPEEYGLHNFHYVSEAVACGIPVNEMAAAGSLYVTDRRKHTLNEIKEYIAANADVYSADDYQAPGF